MQCHAVVPQQQMILLPAAKISDFCEGICCMQSLAHSLHNRQLPNEEDPAGSSSSIAVPASRLQHGGEAQPNESGRSARQQAGQEQQQQQQQNERARLRSATQRGEQGLQAHSQRVQSQMQSMQETFQAMCQSLQSLQGAFQRPQTAAAPSRHEVRFEGSLTSSIACKQRRSCIICGVM